MSFDEIQAITNSSSKGKQLDATQHSSRVKPLAISHGELLLQKEDDPTTLSQSLQRTVLQHPEKGIIYHQRDGSELVQFYPALLGEAQKILAGLRKLGLQPQDKVIFQFDRAQDFISAFWGCVLGGFVPVPIAIAPSYKEANSAVNKLYHAWQLLEKPIILTSQRLAPSLRSLSSLWPLESFRVEALEQLQLSEPEQNWHSSQPEELALLMLTSGSTGMPKAVMLSHQNLLSRTIGSVQLNGFSSLDVTLNWMPLDHVAGLIYFHIRDVYLGCQQIHAPAELVLQNPLKWLDWIDRFRVTVTFAPNFAYGLVNNCAEEIGRRHWDLSSLQWVLNGAEAISAKIARRFLELLIPHKLPATAMHPAWGMAETSSGVTYSHCFSLDSTTDSDLFVEVGTPIPGFSLRIVDDRDRVVEADTIGRLQVRGYSVTSGYYQNQKLNREVFTEDGWFNTGDLGFLHQGRLTLTGRAKDVIIVNGVNYYSHDIEAVVEEIEGIEVSYTAACAVREPNSETDKLAIFFNTALSIQNGLLDLLKEIRAKVLRDIGINPSYLIPVEKEAIPKTSIGKIQRTQLSQRFSSSEFDGILQQLHSQKVRRSQGPPKTEIEKTIASIWQAVLCTDELDIDDNFFDLGGNSLLLAQVGGKLQEVFKKEISLLALFQYSTIRSMTQYLGQQSEALLTSKLNQSQVRGEKRRQRDQGTDIAIIGMAGRFPGARNLEEFWQNLKNGVESISFFSNRELESAGIPSELIHHPHYVKASPVVDDVEMFDAAFFDYNPKEAKRMDPQSRIFMECAWEALESAGYNPKNYEGAIGLYACKAANTYLLQNLYLDLDLQDGFLAGNLQTVIANEKDFLPTRVSYKLNLKGPSINVQTACSSSLVAVHLARQSLLMGECDIAVAGAVAIYLPQKAGYFYKPRMIFSPDGHTRAFDANAQGTIFGSGTGIVVLKPLSDALADGDNIHAVIKGSAINNDGSAKPGYATTSITGQAEVIAEAIANAGVDAETINYVETHGTGTVQGDPIEVAGLTQAFSLYTPKKGFCAIGSVKTNIGHMDVASGITGLIKTVLMLKHKMLVPSLHFEQPNPQIDFGNNPFYVNTKLTQWQTDGTPCRAGVSSFGIGGTNAHVILEEAPVLHPVQANIERPLHLLSLSAKSDKALKELAGRYETYLETHPSESLANVCFTANVGRAHFAHRLAVVASSIAQMRQKLAAFIAGQEIEGLLSGQQEKHQPKIAFLFTGQNSLYGGMGQQLYDTQPVFRDAIDECNALLYPYLKRSLLSVLYPAPEATPPTDEIACAQPALFALEYALIKLWKSWGVEPAAVIGHDTGEYVAACVARVFSLEDGLKLIAERGHLMQSLHQESEGAVFATQKQVAAFKQVAAEITYSFPQIDLISSITGKLVKDEIATPGYWLSHLQQTVRFANHTETLHHQGYEILVEIGPQPTLPRSGPECPGEAVWLPTLNQDNFDWQQLLQNLAELYVRGVQVDWSGFERSYCRCKVDLPTYPFQRQRYWSEEERERTEKHKNISLHKLKIAN